MAKPLGKKEAQDIVKKLSRKPKLAWDAMSAREREDAFKLAEKYKEFLDAGKTEREATAWLCAKAKDNGFLSLTRENAGRRFARVYGNKCLALAQLGEKGPEAGFRIIAAHIDSPRLDLKPNPLYEEAEVAFLKTHYYGGIHKYQWLARPLALHGRVIRADGSRLDFTFGEAQDEPVLTILDILPHLAAEIYGGKVVGKAFEAEKLNVVLGSLPLGPDEVKDRIKAHALSLLNKKYGIVEEDLISSEIEVVPAGRARDVGLDASLVGSYGQDDRICAFAASEALFALHNPKNTAVVFLFDKEEIGSEGRTSARSHVVLDFLSDLLEKQGAPCDERALRRALLKARALSGDVNGAFDPDYQSVHEKRNAAKLGYGVCVTKYTGSRGKAGASDASAEYMAEIRKIFNENKVTWQTGELGRVDAGGGGTVAKFLAAYGMEIVDCGPAILSMHSPFEVASKADVAMTTKGYNAFLNFD